MKSNQAFSNKLLKVLIIGGVITISAVNPFFGLLTAKVVEEELKKRKWEKLREDLYYLKRRKFIHVYRNSDGSYKIRPTNKGRCQITKYNLKNIKIEIPRKWDQCWRLVIFDIPTKKQQGRFALLAKLKELGFIMIQRSVWAYPFECKNEITVISRAFEMDRYTQYLVCHEISAGEYLCREFEKRNGFKLS